MEVLGKLGGRKFLMAIAGVLAVAVSSYFGIDEEKILAVAGIVVSYILGQGYADGKSGGNTSSSAGPVQ